VEDQVGGGEACDQPDGLAGGKIGEAVHGVHVLLAGEIRCALQYIMN
jgi:hypothetical protein